MKNTVTQEDINNILAETDFHIYTYNNKTTVVIATLPNGFTITESSSCVDPANYDEKIGVEICKERITNKIWELEGYVLQTKVYRDKELRDLADKYGAPRKTE
jgi:hypothetical protein